MDEFTWYACGNLRELIENGTIEQQRIIDGDWGSKWYITIGNEKLEIFYCPFCGHILETHCFFYS